MEYLQKEIATGVTFGGTMSATYKFNSGRKKMKD